MTKITCLGMSIYCYYFRERLLVAEDASLCDPALCRDSEK